MSKDRGTKNHKKAPADKSAAKAKVLSAYQSEKKSKSKSGSSELLVPKAGKSLK